MKAKHIHLKRDLFFIYFLFFCSSINLFALQENKIIDSLITLSRKTVVDSTRIDLLNSISSHFKNLRQFPKAINYANDAMQLSEKKGDTLRIAKAYAMLGVIFQDSSDYTRSIANLNKGLSNFILIKNKKGMGECYNNIGISNWYQGNYPEALKFFYKALTIKEELKDKKGIGKTYGNIGLVLRDQGNYEEALIQFKKSLSISEDIVRSSNDKKIKRSASMGIGNGYNNIAMVFRLQKKYDEALLNYTKALDIYKDLNDQQGISVCYNNMGNIFLTIGDNKKTLEYFTLAIKIREYINDQEGLSSSYLNIGAVYYQLNELNKARQSFDKGLALSKKLGNKNVIKECYFDLAETDSVQKNYNSAFEHYKMYIIYRDSLNNELNTKKSVETRMQYAFDKKQAADSVRVAEEKKVVAAELKSEQNKRYGLYGGLSLTIVFAIFILNRFRITRKQKLIIEGQKQVLEYQKKIVEEQKLIVEEKNKDILDSIHYARRIQRSLLPTEKYIIKNLNRLMGTVQ